MAEQLPKETVNILARLKIGAPCTDAGRRCEVMAATAGCDCVIAACLIEHLQEETASYANAHKTLLAERDKAQQLAMRQAAQIKRMSAGETDPPHCPSCDCGRRS